MRATSRYTSIVTKEFGASVKSASAPCASTADQPQLQEMKKSLAALGVTQDLAGNCPELLRILNGSAPLPTDFMKILGYLKPSLPIEYVVDTMACLQKHHPQFVPLIDVPTDGFALYDFMKQATVRGGLVFEVGLSIASGVSSEAANSDTRREMVSLKTLHAELAGAELDALQEMLSRNTCLIKELTIYRNHDLGPKSPRGIAIAKAIKNSKIESVYCSAAWFPYIGPAARIAVWDSNTDKETTSSLLAQGNIESVFCECVGLPNPNIDGQLDFPIIDGLLDAEKKGSRVSEITIWYPNPVPPENVRLVLGKEVVNKLTGYKPPGPNEPTGSDKPTGLKLVTHLQVPSTRLLPPDKFMREWLRTGPVHRFVVEKSADPKFVPTADQILLRKGTLTAVSLEGAAKGFSWKFLGIDDLPTFNEHIVETCLPTARAPALALVNKDTARAALFARRKLYPEWGGKHYAELAPFPITDVPQHGPATNPPNDEKNDETGKPRK